MTMPYQYRRYKEFVQWVRLQIKINENFRGGTGHFYPRKAIINAFLGENVGYEKSGQRPCLIVSNDQINRKNGNIVVVPLTKIDNKTDSTGRVTLLDSQYILYKAKYKLNFDSIVQCEDIRVISKERLGNLIDFVDKDDMKNINKRLKFTFGI
jgi:mRNA interferase MazF